MGHVVFLHGVPDTPRIWDPLIDALGLAAGGVLTPALPGFVSAPPKGFDRTKEAYVDWFIQYLADQYRQSGPVDLIAHDWGALIALRTISLRPDLVRSWAVFNAVPHPEDRWHSTAKRWQTPILGELVMMMLTERYAEKMLKENGLTDELAAYEARHINGEMKRSVLALYRSAKKIGSEWYPGFDGLPGHGLIGWGEDDPFGPIELAKTFAARYQIPFRAIANAGHWPIVEKPDEVAAMLKTHWDAAP